MKPKTPYTGIDPPEGFQGFNPQFPFSVYHRHLPHWRQKGVTYAVTFRQKDALPKSKVKEIKDLRTEWEAANPEPRSEIVWQNYAREFTRRVDVWLDENYGRCLFSSQNYVQLLANAVTKFHRQRYFVGAFVIMPNHCHLLIQPFADEELELLLKGIKGAVSRAIQKETGHTGGNLWEQESYDRIIRDPDHLRHAINYIGANPAKAGLGNEQSWRCWIAPEWKESGWSFEAT